MGDFPTLLRNAVLTVLLDEGGPDKMTAQDYAFLNSVSSFAQSRMIGATDDTLTKMQDARRATLANGDGLPAVSMLPTLAPHDEAKLPLGEADRGPDPQAVETLATTAPAVEPQEPDPTFDPTDPPPDYGKL